MPIRFHCSGCQYLLQVPDDAAGKKARCPRCQSIADVPLTSQVTDDAATANSSGKLPPPASDDPYRLAPEEKLPSPPPSWAAAKPLGPLPTKPLASDNPYQSPSYAYNEPPFGAGMGSDGKPPLQHSVIVLDQVFSHAWRIFNENMGLLVGVGAVVLGVSLLRGLLSGVVEGLVAGSTNDKDLANIASQVFNLATWPVMLFFEIGQVIVYLKVARGERTEFSEMFGGGRYLLRLLGARALFNIMIFFGMCALIVPGVFLALMFWPYYIFIIDRDQRVFESFSSAQQFTEGNKGSMFVIFLANFGIMILGVLMLCIGIIFTFPLVTMLLVVSYLMMTGQFYGERGTPAP